MENIVNIINSIVWSTGLAWPIGDIGVGLMAWQT